MKKRIYTTACLIALISGTCIAMPTMKVKPASDQVIELLNAMNTQLEQLTAQQTQTQKTLSAYAKFQITNTYPSVPFPGWQAVLTQTQKAQIKLFSADPAPLKPNGIALTATEQNIQKNINTATYNANIIASRINTYRHVLFNNLNEMNLTQIERIKTKIDLLNTELSELKYTQSIQDQRFNLLKLYIQHTNKKKGLNHA